MTGNARNHVIVVVVVAAVVVVLVVVVIAVAAVVVAVSWLVDVDVLQSIIFFQANCMPCF